MKLKYAGTVKELKADISQINRHAYWKKLERGYWQCDFIDGPVLNFYPTTKTILVQGTERLRDLLMQDLVEFVEDDHIRTFDSKWILIRPADNSV